MTSVCCSKRRLSKVTLILLVSSVVILLIVAYSGRTISTDVFYYVYLRHREPIANAEAALKWDGDPIQTGDPQWQKVDNLNQAFVYSAHYDDLGLSPLIRVIGIALDPLPFFFVTCRYFHSWRESSEFFNVSGTIAHLRKRNGRRYLAAYVECPLPPDSSMPYALSVDQGNTLQAWNYMIINYSSQTDWTVPFTGDTAPHPAEDYDGDDSNDGGGKATTGPPPPPQQSPQLSSRGRDDQGWLWNATRCFPAFQMGFNDHVMLAEMMAVSRLLGVQHFVFYVQSAGPRVLAMLKVLEAQGDVKVLPWNMNMGEEDLYYAGQFSSINDCLYRHLWTSRYLLFGDVDELFVQRDRPALLDLLHEEFTQNPECGAFLFLNVFFNLHFPPPPLPPINGTTPTRLQQLKMLTHTRRHTKVFNPTDRSKPVLDPRKVLTGSVHEIETFRDGFKSCVMEADRGLLHHYREYTVPSSDQQIDDPYLWGLYEEIAEEMVIILDAYEASTNRK